jgi:HEAT repeat protein
VDDERSMIRELGKSPSKVAVEDLLTKLRSPSFSVRTEALAALRLHPADHAVAKALVKEITDHEFTTAHIAAETIGAKLIREAIPALRAALASEDFMLCGKAMVSLSELGDRESLPRMREVFAASSNPRVIIHGARAFANYRDPRTVAPMVHKLEPTIAPFVRDEIILAIAEVLGIGKRFYPAYILFLERHLAGTAELLELTLASQADHRALVLETTGDPAVFSSAAHRVYRGSPPVVAGIDLAAIILEALENPTILGLVRFRFLVAAIAVMLETR